MGKDSSVLERDYPFIVEHTKTSYIFKWMIYGSVKSIGIDFEYLTGDGLCNYPLPMLCTGENIQTYLKKKKKKKKCLIFNDSNKMLTKISPKKRNLGRQVHRTVIYFFFLLTACFKFVSKSIHQIAQFQFQKYKISQLLRGDVTLPVHSSGIWHCDPPPPQIITKIVKKLIYAPG